MKSYEELNALLVDKCIAWAKANPHPEMTDRTVWEVFEAERPQLVPYAGRFDGFHSVPAAVSKTCLVRFDNNKYSVMASAVAGPARARPTSPSPSRALSSATGPAKAAHHTKAPEMGCVAPPPEGRDILAASQDRPRLKCKDRAVMEAPSEGFRPCSLNRLCKAAFPMVNAGHEITARDLPGGEWCPRLS